MKTLILALILLTGSAFAQDYGPKAADKESAVRMHFAISLLRGSFNKSQESFLLKAISNRRSISEEEAARLFTRTELRDIFFGIGREDLTTFRELYGKSRVIEKKEAWLKLPASERTDVRRINFAWVIGYSNLDDVQIDFLVRFSKALPNITREQLDLFHTEALGMFAKETGQLLFGSIGPYTDKCVPTNDLQPRNCRCSIGSSFNLSCENDCGTEGPACTTTPDGCGFAWLYSCDGKCQ